MRKRNSGFSLLELLVVLGILGVLASFILFRFTGGQSGARDARRQSDIKQYQSAIEVYSNSHNGLFPPNPSGNQAINLCGGGNALGNIPCVDDPLGGTAHYQYSTNGTRTTYTIWATLEKGTPARIYYVCGSGKSATVAATGFNGANGNCP